VLHKLLEVVRLTSKTGSKALRIDLLLFRCTTVILFDPHKCKKGQETVRLAEGSESTCSLPSGHCAALAALAVLAPSASSNTVSPLLWETLFVPCGTIFEDE
jgi:membrane-associated phospholipid phosphatase